MLKRTKLCTSLMIAFGSGIAVPAMAQQTMERVEITGSSIRRVDAETALPVTVIKVEELTKQGVTNAEQAMQRIAANQSNFGVEPLDRRHHRRQGRGRPARPGRPDRRQRQQDPGSPQRPADRQPLVRRRRGRPERDSPQRHRPDRSPARRRLGDLRYRRDRRRDQLHPEARLPGLRDERPDAAAAGIRRRPDLARQRHPRLGLAGDERLQLHGLVRLPQPARAGGGAALLLEDRHHPRRRHWRHQRHQLPGRPERLRAVAAELRPAGVDPEPGRHRPAATTSRATSTSFRRTSRPPPWSRAASRSRPITSARSNTCIAKNLQTSRVAAAPTSAPDAGDQPVLPRRRDADGRAAFRT